MYNEKKNLQKLVDFIHALQTRTSRKFWKLSNQKSCRTNCRGCFGMTTKCCKNKSKYNIIYKVGEESKAWLVCDVHYALVPFQQSIKSIKEVTETKWPLSHKEPSIVKRFRAYRMNVKLYVWKSIKLKKFS